MPRKSNKRQRTSSAPDCVTNNNICILPNDSSRRQLSIKGFCFQQQRKSRQNAASSSSPSNTSIKTPPTEASSITSQEDTPPSPVSPNLVSNKVATSKVDKNNDTKKKRQLAQVFLDCGQRNWGQIICKKCGTLYVPGVAEDEKMHSQRCKPITQGVTFSQSSHQKLVVPNFGNHSLKIIQVKKPAPAKMARILEIVERDLGMNSQRAVESPHEIFLCLNNKDRVMGFLSTKPVSIGFQMMTLYERDVRKQSCILGVAILWTHSLMRHQGIATQLIDAARHHAIFGMVVPKPQIAFSSPTEAGYKFAKQYCGQDPLVYEYNGG